MTTPPRSLDDSSAPLRAAARNGVLGVVVLAVVAAVLGGLLAGAEGLWGALLGTAVGGGFVLFTVAVVIGTARSAPVTQMSVLMGTWLLKLLVLIGVLAALAQVEFYDRTTFGIVVIAAVVWLLGLETLAVVRTRSLYVSPEPSAAGDG